MKQVRVLALAKAVRKGKRGEGRAKLSRLAIRAGVAINMLAELLGPETERRLKPVSLSGHCQP